MRFVRVTVLVAVTVAGGLATNRTNSRLNSVWLTGNLARFTFLFPVLK